MPLTITQRGTSPNKEKPSDIVRGDACRLPWAWDGLCFAVPFNDPTTKDTARDIVYNVAPSQWAGSPSFGKDNRGNVAIITSNADYFSYANTPAHNRPTTAVTAYLRFRRNGTTSFASGQALFCKVHTVNADPWRTWDIQIADTSTTKLAGSITTGGVNVYWESAYTTDTTTWISVFLRWRSGGIPQLDILGERGNVLSSANLGSTVTGSLTYNTAQPIRINEGDNPTNDSVRGAYSQCALWSRYLTDVEMRAFTDDPYGWYSPSRESVVMAGPYPLFGGQAILRAAEMVDTAMEMETPSTEVFSTEGSE